MNELDLGCEALRALFSYDPISGMITWKGGPERTHCAGKIAGTKNALGYLEVEIRRRRVRAHRLAWLLHHGDWPAGQLDHANGIKTDNRLMNLRLATPMQNCQNMKLRSDNTSGVKGVHWDKRRGKWEAKLKHFKKLITLGRFSSLDEATDAVRSKRLELHGEFACHG